jgi:GH24 family phage-related lysozyme (muramidase)
MAQYGEVVTVCIGKTLKAPLYGVTTLTREEVENLLDSGLSNRRLRRAAAKLNVNTKEVANAA